MSEACVLLQVGPGARYAYSREIAVRADGISFSILRSTELAQRRQVRSTKPTQQREVARAALHGTAGSGIEGMAP